MEWQYMAMGYQEVGKLAHGGGGEGGGVST